MLSINYKDPRPIYEQVRDALRQLILSGAIAPGEKLPSVRELAASLAHNPNTTSAPTGSWKSSVSSIPWPW